MSWAIWITGLPGSGKTTLARGVAAALKARGIPLKRLELDEIRRVVTPAPTYSASEREIVYRALVYMAKLLTEAGVPVVMDATGHRKAWRDLARRLIPRFAEVQLQCPLSVCMEREQTRHATLGPQGIYARGGQPGSTVPGLDFLYEESLSPELELDTNTVDLRTQIQEVLYLARRLSRPAARREYRAASAGKGQAV